MQPVAAGGVFRRKERHQLLVQGAEVGGGLDEGFRQGVGGEPAGEGFGGCGDLLCAGEVELGDSGELRWG